MKAQLLLAALLLSPAAAFAHGSAIHQAAEAIDKCGQLFAASQPKEIQRLFQGVSAVKTGHEQFMVTLQLSNNTRFAYACRENEDVVPVAWECEAK